MLHTLKLLLDLDLLGPYLPFSPAAPDRDRQECFTRMTTWQRSPNRTIAGMWLYEQMLPTTVYSYYKIGTTSANDTTCRLCGKGMENVAHVIVGCSALAQSNSLKRHKAALKVLYFELLRDLKLVDEVHRDTRRPNPSHCMNLDVCRRSGISSPSITR